MGINLIGLTAICQYKAEEAIAIMRAQDIRFVITDTFRSTIKQQALFAQGRKTLDEVNELRAQAGLYQIITYIKNGSSHSDNDYIVTNCDGIIKKSKHQSGNAIDIVPANKKGNPYWPPIDDPIWLPIVLAMEACGFEAGYRWAGNLQDAPHYQLKGA